jgi:hypothetical protein
LTEECRLNKVNRQWKGCFESYLSGVIRYDCQESTGNQFLKF